MVQNLPDTPLDIVGDIHGELEALLKLLSNLGYDRDGHHPEGRRLVFVGDLIDRGPDSPGVVALVRRFVEAGRALAILGNHELNLIRGSRKKGNDWFWGEGNPRDLEYAPFAAPTDSQKSEILGFLNGLPLALARVDLQITHASWDWPSLTRLAGLNSKKPIAEIFNQLEAEIDSTLVQGGWLERGKEEKAKWKAKMEDPKAAIPLLPALIHCEEARQNLNPLKVLTSGPERATARPFYTSGKWRFLDRVKWWEEYTDATPVVVGHYWRQWVPWDRAKLGKGDPDLFEDVDPRAWTGKLGNVFCVDFSVGGRYHERRAGVKPGERTRLGALRWPERTLALDTGETVPTLDFGGK